MEISPSYTANINSCQMLFYAGKRVTIVSNQKVQRQQGASDCGLFAIHSTLEMAWWVHQPTIGGCYCMLDLLAWYKLKWVLSTMLSENFIHCCGSGELSSTTINAVEFIFGSWIFLYSWRGGFVTAVISLHFLCCRLIVTVFFWNWGSFG